MMQKVLVVGLAVVMVAGFAIGVGALGRDLIWGTETAQARGAGRALVQESNGSSVVAAAQGRGQAGRNQLVEERAVGNRASEEQDDCASEALGQEAHGNVQGQRGGGIGRNAVDSYGNGGGQGNAGSGFGSGTQEPITHNPEWREISGTVVEYDHEIILATDQGEVLVGMGQSTYVEAQGFAAQVGDQLIVWGFDEDGEFKAGQVQNLTAGTQITLRDQDGRPMWAGYGNRQNQKTS